MITGTVLLAFTLGAALGALLTLVWRARREQRLRIDAEVLRERIKTE
jgi:hypothetical protein